MPHERHARSLQSAREVAKLLAMLLLIPPPLLLLPLLLLSLRGGLDRTRNQKSLQ
jgi:hypothetical protein